MSEHYALIDDLYDALRLKRRLEQALADGAAPEPQQLADLESYIEVLATHGLGSPDELAYEPSTEPTEYTQVLRIAWGGPSDLWRAVKRNINRDGIFLQTDDFPSIDTVLGVAIDMAEPALSVTLPAKVIWVNPQARAGRPQGMGLKFLWRDEEQRGVFRRFLEGDLDPAELAALG